MLDGIIQDKTWPKWGCKSWWISYVEEDQIISRFCLRNQ